MTNFTPANSSFAIPFSSTPSNGGSMDLILIEGFKGETVIGIHDSELHRPQPVVIDVYAGVPRLRACETDSITDTIDYGLIRHRLQRLLVEHGVQLLEAFAQAVADVVLYEFHASWVRVKVVKPAKFDDVDALGVRIDRIATERESPQRAGTVLQLIGSGMVPGDR